ncbi:MAG: hypothetical protein IT385_15505 [Deltaproteobacteria bacterium]|nr:hypothetical protein [Deltaproteobacteria bacterium]
MTLAPPAPETMTPSALEAHLEAGATTQIGAVDASGRPAICRGLTSFVEADGRITLVLSRTSGFEVVPMIAATRRVSAVFVLPASYRTIHLKGVDAEVAPAAHLRPRCDARHVALDAQLAPYGYPPEFTESWYAIDDEELVAIRFTPIGAWNQTPGPGAGNRLDLAR